MDGTGSLTRCSKRKDRAPSSEHLRIMKEGEKRKGKAGIGRRIKGGAKSRKGGRFYLSGAYCVEKQLCEGGDQRSKKKRWGACRVGNEMKGGRLLISNVRECVYNHPTPQPVWKIQYSDEGK